MCLHKKLKKKKPRTSSRMSNEDIQKSPNLDLVGCVADAIGQDPDSLDAEFFWGCY